MNWSRKLTRSFALRAGGKIATLSEARAYMLELDEGTQQRSAWQAAAGALQAQHGIAEWTAGIQS